MANRGKPDLVKEVRAEIDSIPDNLGYRAHMERALGIIREAIEYIDSIRDAKRTLVEWSEGLSKAIEVFSGQQPTMAASKPTSQTTGMAGDDLSEMSARKAAITVLREEGKPLTTSTILERMKARGKDPGSSSSLSSSMSTAKARKEIRQIKEAGYRAVWALKEWEETEKDRLPEE